MANSITIEIELDESGAVKGFKDVEQKAKESGKKSGDNLEKGFSSGFKKVAKTAAKIAAVAGAVISALAIRESVKAAIQQEEAVRSLNSSLALAGTFSKQASEDIQRFASDLQKVTTIGDETTLALFGLARNMTKTNSEAKKLTSAAVQLSAATGMNLESSLKNLGKTFSGLTGELGESLPAVKQFTAEQLKAGAALDFVLKRFGGAAEAKVNTFAGAIKQLANAYGDSLEEQGFFITKSPVLIGLIQKLTEYFTGVTEATKKFRQETGDIFKPIAKALIAVAGFVNNYLVRPFEVAFAVIKNIFSALFGTIGGAGDSIGGFASKAKEMFMNAFSAISDFIGKLIPIVTEYAEIGFNYITEQAGAFAEKFMVMLSQAINYIKPFVSTVMGVLGGLFSGASGSFDEILDGIVAKMTSMVDTLRPILATLGIDVDGVLSQLKNGFESIIPEGDTFEEKFANVLDKFGNFKDMAMEQLSAFKEIVKDAIAGGLDTPLADKLQARLGEMSEFVDNAKLLTNDLKNNSQKGFDGVTKGASDMVKKLNGLINGAMVNVVAAGFERFGRQLIEGKKAWQEWEKAIASIIGDLLINLGKALIVKGLAIDALGKALATLSGGIAVAAGLGLIALGGALKAGAGVGVSEVTSGASAGGVAEATAEEAEAVADFEPEQQEQTQNQIIVQGDVFDSEETGLRIFDIISEQSEKNGNVIVGGAFA